MTTIAEALTKAKTLLKKEKIACPELDSAILLSFIFKKNKEYLFTYPQQNIQKKHFEKFFSLIKKRAQHQPLAYLTKQKDFFGRTFYVDNRVLVPRPETELLVEKAIQILKNDDSLKTVLEIGVGSGVISITLFLELATNKKTWFASDKSSAALAVAQKNAKKFKTKIRFLKGNLWQPAAHKKIDLLLANLPYLEKKTKKQLKTSAEKSLLFEPRNSLFSAKRGLAEYIKLFTQLKNTKNKPRRILLEIGHNQAKNLKKIIYKAFPLAKIELFQDLSGFDRIIDITLNNG